MHVASSKLITWHEYSNYWYHPFNLQMIIINNYCKHLAVFNNYTFPRGWILHVSFSLSSVKPPATSRLTHSSTTMKEYLIGKVNRGNFVSSCSPFHKLCEDLRSKPAVYLVAIGSYVVHLEAQRLCMLCSRNHEETKLPRIRNYPGLPHMYYSKHVSSINLYRRLKP